MQLWIRITGDQWKSCG